MRVVCDKCDYGFEHYNNMYGTRCPKCNKYIKSNNTIKFLKEYNLKLKKLSEMFLKKLRK